jgi:hypothetical protein
MPFIGEILKDIYQQENLTAEQSMADVFWTKSGIPRARMKRENSQNPNRGKNTFVTQIFSPDRAFSCRLQQDRGFRNILRFSLRRGKNNLDPKTPLDETEEILEQILAGAKKGSGFKLVGRKNDFCLDGAGQLGEVRYDGFGFASEDASETRMIWFLVARGENNQTVHGLAGVAILPKS